MGTVNTNLTPEIVSSDKTSEKNCLLNWEINNEEDNDGKTTYYIGSTYLARLYKGSSILSVKVFSTIGSVNLAGTGTAEKTEQISFSGTRTAELSYPCSGGFSYEIFGKAYDIDGNVANISFKATTGTTTISANKECYCIINVTYNVKYSKYKFSSSEEGSMIIVAISNCGGESVSSETTVTFGEASSSISSSSSYSSVRTTTVTFIYKDFVTGTILPDVSFFLDGENKGKTDESGKIIIHGVTVNEKHTISGTKEGYLNTDSDSLENDMFIINAS